MDGAWDAEAIFEEAVIGDTEFTAGLEQAEHGVASGFPVSVTVPPEILGLVTTVRMSFSDPLVWSGISVGRGRVRDVSLLPAQADELPVERPIAGD